MNASKEIRPPGQADSGTTLEDRVYRVNLSEGNRWMGGASVGKTVPLTLAVFAMLGGLVFLAARQDPAQALTVRTVAIVLQEGLDAPAPAAGPASAPVQPPSAAPTPAPVQPLPPAPAPAPPQPREAPLPPAQVAPATAPTALPSVDHSRDYGSAAGAASAGTGNAGGGAGGTAGSAVGSGGAGSGGGTARVLDLDFSQVRPKFRPPAPNYPALARNAGIQGEVAVQILIGPDGVPVSAHAAAGPPQLRAAAESNGLAWRFYPFLQNGVPQFCRFLVTFTFRIK